MFKSFWVDFVFEIANVTLGFERERLPYINAKFVRIIKVRPAVHEL